MEQIMEKLQSIQFDWSLFLKAAVVMCAASLVFGLIGKFIFRKRSSLEQSLSAAIGILFVYSATVVFYCLGGEFLDFTAPLPYISIEGDTLTLFSFEGAAFQDICTQVLSMVILAFTVNLVTGLIPEGENLFSWLFFRCLTVALAVLAHRLVTYLFGAYLPDVIVTYAPTILLILLVLTLLVGVLRFFVGAALATINPIIGIIYTFFFATIVGKALSKAVLTTLILSALVWLLGYIGIATVCIASAALVAYVPLLVALLVIWYIVNKLL